MQVTFIRNAREVAQHWHEAGPMLAPVVTEAARGEFDLGDLERLTASGKAVTALVHDDDGSPAMALVFEFVHYPRRYGINVVACGGSGLDRMLDRFMLDFRMWASQAGAEFLEASCSRAMARMLQRHGYAIEYQVVRSAL